MSQAFLIFANCSQPTTVLNPWEPSPSLEPTKNAVSDIDLSENQWRILEDKTFTKYRAARVAAKVFGYSVSAILDSGAGHSAVSGSYARQIAYHQRLTLQPWCWGKIKIADGRHIGPSHYICIRVTIGSKVMDVPVAVIETLPDNLLLGNDFLERSKANILWEQKIVTFLGTTVVQPIVIDVASCQQSLEECGAFLFSSGEVTIPAHSERDVLVTFPHNHPICKNPSTLFEVTSDVWMVDKLHVAVAQGVAPFTNGMAYLRIANFHHEPRYLAPGISVGVAMPYLADAAAESLAIEIADNTNTNKETNASRDDQTTSSSTQSSALEADIDKMAQVVEDLLKKMKVDLERYTASQRTALIRLVYQYREVFDEKPGCCDLAHHEIPTGSNPPISAPPH
jgi:hypothetical protein